MYTCTDISPFFIQQEASSHPTWIEIDAHAFWHNVALIKEVIGFQKLALVIKANAYGHGLKEVGRLAQEHPFVDVLCTATIDEAVQLRQLGVTKPIVALYDPGIRLDAAFKESIEVGVYSKGMLERVIAATELSRSSLAIHLKVDTGMVRLGIDPYEVNDVIKRLKDTQLILSGIFTHLADKSKEDEISIHQQLSIFCHVVDAVKQAGYYPPLIHALSSGSLHNTSLYPYLTMARVGAHAYGLMYHTLDRQRLRNIPSEAHFKPILTWKTKIMHLKEVPAGTPVGYGKTFITCRQTKLAILPLGYAEGFPRSLSNRGSVLIKSTLVPVVGIVSMNLITIDVTDITDVTVGQEVTLIGQHEGISATKHAATLGTIALDITTGLSSTITRSILLEDIFDHKNAFQVNEHAE